MTMIPNHHSLNIASNGQHFARVEFQPGLSQGEAIERAKLIEEALQCHESSETRGWSLSMTRVDCSGYTVSIK